MFGLGKKKEKEITDSTASDVESPELIDDAEQGEKDVVGKEQEAKQNDPPPLTFKEAKALKKSNYDDKIKDNPRFKNAYVLRNKRTGQIVQIRAASSFHACNIIGWKPNKVKVLAVQPIPEETSLSKLPEIAESEPVEIKEVKKEASPEAVASA